MRFPLLALSFIFSLPASAADIGVLRFFRSSLVQGPDIVHEVKIYGNYGTDDGLTELRWIGSSTIYVLAGIWAERNSSSLVRRSLLLHRSLCVMPSVCCLFIFAKNDV
ncbi:hypothetical protein FRC19_006897 [Serendipita sp. 401]|nr:hypothetical protein FRC19_006897 [Serendipita sp. 401]